MFIDIFTSLSHFVALMPLQHRQVQSESKQMYYRPDIMLNHVYSASTEACMHPPRFDFPTEIGPNFPVHGTVLFVATI
jgi:hypothetical protein